MRSPFTILAGLFHGPTDLSQTIRKGDTGDLLSALDLEASPAKADFVAIDLELTGLDERKDAIVAIAGIKMTGGKIDMSQTYYSLVRPELGTDVDNVVIHEITPSDLKSMRTIDKVLPEFIDFCSGGIVVGFLPLIDITFIKRELNRLMSRQFTNPVVDIFIANKWLHQRCQADYSRDLNLYEIAAEYEIAVRGAHNAQADAFMTAQVWQQMLPELAAFGISSVEGLLAACRMSDKDDRFRFSSKLSNL